MVKLRLVVALRVEVSLGYLSPPPAPAPVVVYKDVGGLVSDYEAQTEQYRRENREVRLHECRSACTLALSLPNVCVYPDAKIKFHQAYNALTREVDLGVSSRLFASYPAQVQARLGYLTRDYRVLSGSELIALGMRNCNGDNPVLIAARKEKAGATMASAAQLPAQGAQQPAQQGSWGDIASRVQSAVAAALNTPEGKPSGALRVAVADRQPISQEESNATARLEDMTRMRATLETIPLPPKRPDNFGAAAREIEPRLKLMAGADPILPEASFSAPAN